MESRCSKQETQIYPGGKIGNLYEANIKNWILKMLKNNPGIFAYFSEREKVHRYLVSWYGEFPGKFLTAVAEAMLIAACVLILLIIVFAVIGACRTIKKKNTGLLPEYVSLWIMSIVLIVSECSFCFSYPVVCTEAFRYIAPVVVPAAVWSGRMLMMSEDPKNSKAYKILSAGFVIVTCILVLTVILFYGASAQYHLIWNDLFIRQG